MLCKNPYLKGVMACGCGQCLPCRINRRRMWAQRLMLEKMTQTDACFVTLTYRDEEIWDVSSDWSAVRGVIGNLVPKDAQDWLKRIRKEVLPTKLRYFLVGEYGDVNERPHYHVALFGLPSCFNGRTNNFIERCCSVCELVKGTWAKGRIDVGELNEHSSGYIAGYVTKKWTKEDVWTKKKLKGRHPEFVRMSLRPGIGADAVKKLITSGESTRRRKWLKMCLDAPVVLRKNGSLVPLGRYLRRKWREALGRSPDTPQSILGQYCEEMYKLRETYREQAKKDGIPSVFTDARGAHFGRNGQKIKSLEARDKIFQTERSL